MRLHQLFSQFLYKVSTTKASLIKLKLTVFVDYKKMQIQIATFFYYYLITFTSNPNEIIHSKLQTMILKIDDLCVIFLRLSKVLNVKKNTKG